MIGPIRAITQLGVATGNVGGSKGKAEELGESPAPVPLRHDSLTGSYLELDSTLHGSVTVSRN
jgi:hypothetical protein